MFKVVIISGLCAVAALAQSSTPQMKIKLDNENSFGPIGITAALAGPLSSIPGAPYSAQAVTQQVQMLADGNRITQTTTNAVARDNQGRVRREESLPGMGNGTAEAPHLVLIEDPIAGVHITLDSNSKTAVKIPFGQMKKSDEAAARNGVPPIGANKMWFQSTGSGQQIQIITSKAKLDEEAKTTTTIDLGTQTIEGLVAKGTKTTHTIPAGEMGNDLPIVITTEIWRSPDLRVLVLSKSSDPRMGETTYKLTNVSRAEPDAALFQIPADYTIKEQTYDMLIFQKD